MGNTNTGIVDRYWLPTDILRLIISQIPGHERSFRAVNRRTREMFPVRELPLVCSDLVELSFGGHLSVLQLYPIKSVLLYDYTCITESVLGNQLEILQWIHKNGGYIDSHLLKLAISKRHWEIAIWLYQNNCTLVTSVANAIARTGNLEMVKVFYQRDHYTMLGWYLGAIRGGQIEILQWFYTQQPNSFYPNFYCDAIEYGQFNVVKWLYEIGCAIDSYACRFAVMSNRLDILKWLCERGGLLSEDLCELAVRCGRLELLQWLRDPAQNCPWNLDTCRQAAVDYREVSDWIATQ